MPCEIPMKRSGEILLPRLPLQECFSKACWLLTQKIWTYAIVPNVL